MLEMFTGEVTWAAGQAGAAALEAYAESGAERAECPHMPRQVALLLARCLCFPPGERPQDMGAIAESLTAIHAEVSGEPYVRPRPRAAALQADGLNNRALSYLDLGREDEARACWQSALDHDALHPEAVYNSLVWRWRRAEIDDDGLLRQLAVLGKHGPLSPRAALVTALAQLERGFRESVEALLENHAGEEAEATLRRARSGDLGLGRPLRRFGAHRGAVTALCLSVDGRQAVTAGEDATLRTWDLDRGQLLLTFTGHESAVRSLGLAADGRRAVSGGEDKTVRLWDLSRNPRRWLLPLSRDPSLAWNHNRRTLEGHAAAVRRVCISADGRWALSGSDDATLRLWDLDGARCERTFEHEPIVALWLSSDGRRAASAGRTSIRLWDLKSGRNERSVELPRYEGNKVPVDWSWVQFSPDGRYALWADQEPFGGHMSILRLDGSEPVRAFPAAQWQHSEVLFSPSQERLLAWNYRALRLYDIHSGRCLLTLRDQPEGWVGATCIAIGGDGRTVFSGTPGGSVLEWRLPKETHRVDSLQPSRPTSHSELSDVATRVQKLRESARSAIAGGRFADAHRQLVEARSFSGNERTAENMAAWRDLSLVCVRRRLRGAWRVRGLQGHEGRVTDACLGHDGSWAASASEDKTIRIWDTASGESSRILSGHQEQVTSLSVSADGRFLLSAALDGLRLWERETGRCVRTLSPVVEPRTYCTVRASLSPDGAWAASAGSGPVKIWAVSSGRCVRQLEGSYPAQVDWSPDGRQLILADGLSHGGVRRWLQVWDAATGRCLRTMKKYTSPFCPGTSGHFALACRRHWGGRRYTYDDGRSGHHGGRYSLGLLDLRNGRCARSVDSPIDLGADKLGTGTFRLSEDGRWILFGGRLVDLSDPEQATVIASPQEIAQAWLSPDAAWVLATDMDKGARRTLSLWQLDWELEPRAAVDWDEAARPYLESFLALHTPWAQTLPAHGTPTPDEVTRALTRRGTPAWGHADFERLRHALGRAGLGFIRPDGLRRRLEEMRTGG